MTLEENIKIETGIIKEERKQLKKVGRLLYRPNHILWEYNNSDNTLRKAEFIEESTIVFNSKVQKRRILAKEDCHYFQSLNLKNAKKYLTKSGVLNFNCVKE